MRMEILPPHGDLIGKFGNTIDYRHEVKSEQSNLGQCRCHNLRRQPVYDFSVRHLDTRQGLSDNSPYYGVVKCA
jgi:hypothetical protein